MEEGGQGSPGWGRGPGPWVWAGSRQGEYLVPRCLALCLLMASLVKAHPGALRGWEALIVDETWGKLTDH